MRIPLGRFGEIFVSHHRPHVCDCCQLETYRRGGHRARTIGYGHQDRWVCNECWPRSCWRDLEWEPDE